MSAEEVEARLADRTMSKDNLVAGCCVVEKGRRGRGEAPNLSQPNTRDLLTEATSKLQARSWAASEG